jgi:heme O synthase-like polyprenyltransferase
MQMPHFLALAWLCKDDYARGGFRMLPSIDPTGRRTAAVALRHTALLLPLGLVAAAMQVCLGVMLAACMGSGCFVCRRSSAESLSDAAH